MSYSSENAHSTTALEDIAMLYLNQIKRFFSSLFGKLDSRRSNLHLRLLVDETFKNRCSTVIGKCYCLLCTKKKSKSLSKCSLSLMSVLSSEASCASNFSCNKLTTLALSLSPFAAFLRTERSSIIFVFDCRHR